MDEQICLPFLVDASNSIIQWRCMTFWEKEPETIAFIKDFGKMSKCSKNPIFLDIGANIGLYSLYAASLYPDMTIIAIEPERENYQELLKNININNFRNIIPLPVAISNSNGARYFKYPDEIPSWKAGMTGAGINHDVQYNTPQENTYLVMSMIIDMIYHLFGSIDFIKIDVDGDEFDILFGMRRCLPYISAVLVEMNLMKKKHTSVIRFFEEKGFTLENDYNNCADHSRLRRVKEEIPVENFIFIQEKIMLKWT